MLQKSKIPVEVSARHVHLSQKDFERLFGKNCKLKSIKKLSQEDDFASDKKIELINSKNPKNKLKARVLGPTRKKTQVEISITDSFNLNLKPIPPINISGDLRGAKSIILQGPKGKINAKVIIAQRHLHCSAKDAKILKLKHGQKVKIKVAGKRALIFDNVIVRIKKDYRLALHLDTDEANASGISINKKKKIYGKLVK